MLHLHEALANLLEYPGQDWEERLTVCRQSLRAELPEQLTHYEEFCQRTGDFTLFALQELYTQTFDLNPVCALEVGYHLFGEDYRRGFFLAHLRETESPFALGQAQQLPDYLPVLLRLLSKLGDSELRHDLMGVCLLPALGKMHAALQESNNPYSPLIHLVSDAVKAEVGDEVCCETAVVTSKAKTFLPVLAT